MGAFTTLLCGLAVLAASTSGVSSQARRRRQLFREQVLPQSGGKIPEDAFRTDRLALNRLNKEGIAIPDGVLLEARHRESHFSSHRRDPDIDASIIKLIQQPDGRYAPPEGRYPFNNLVESTYVIRPSINMHGYTGLPPRKPNQATLQLPGKPFFSNDDIVDTINNVDNIDLINTLAQEFPGTRLWTGFGPLFHETTNRILRHSGSKQQPAQKGDGPAANQLTYQPGKQRIKFPPHTQAIIGGVQSQPSNQSQNISNNQNLATHNVLPQLHQPSTLTPNQFSVSSGSTISNPTIAAAAPPTAPAKTDFSGVRNQAFFQENGNRSDVRTLQLVNGVLSAVNIPNANRQQGGGRVALRPHGGSVQPLRPGPGHILKTHLTAPPLGYPSLGRIPNTSFDCRKAKRQMESDPQTNCQVFHLCHPDGRKESFLCPAGSRYDVKTNLCSSWTNVPCPADS